MLKEEENSGKMLQLVFGVVEKQKATVLGNKFRVGWIGYWLLVEKFL